MGQRTYSPEFKLQVVLEALQSDGTDAEVARAYDVHPVTLSGWKTKLKENGSKAFGAGDELKEKKEKIAKLERMVGQKEVEIALLKNFFGRKLTTSEKVRLVDQHKEEYGLNRCLEAIGLPKSTYYYRKNRSEKPSEEEQELMDHIREIIQEHPGYGYRRILPDLEERAGQVVNHKRLRRLLNEHELGLPRQVSKRSPSPVQKILGEAAGQLNLVTDLDPKPLEAFSTDFTELAYAGGSRKAYLMAVVDLESKYVADGRVRLVGQWGRAPIENLPCAAGSVFATRWRAWGRISARESSTTTWTAYTPATGGYGRLYWRIDSA